MVACEKKPAMINFWLNSFSSTFYKLCPFLRSWLAISANVLQEHVKLKYQKCLCFHEAIPHRWLNSKVPKGHCIGIKFAERLSRGSSDGIFFFKWLLLNTLWLREIFALSNLWILKMSHVWQRWFSSRQRRDKFHQDRQKSNHLPLSFNEGYKNPRQTFPGSS